MAGTQTTAAVAQSKFEIAVSTDASTWTAICGEAVSMTISGGEQIIGETATACGEGMIVTGSNRHQPFVIEVTAVYTETASTEAFDYVWDRFMTNTTKTLAVRWAPSGGMTTVVGNRLFCTSKAGSAAEVVPIVNVTPPSHDASAADPAVFTFSVRSPLIYETTTATT